MQPSLHRYCTSALFSWCILKRRSDFMRVCKSWPMTSWIGARRGNILLHMSSMTVTLVSDDSNLSLRKAMRSISQTISIILPCSNTAAFHLANQFSGDICMKSFVGPDGPSQSLMEGFKVKFQNFLFSLHNPSSPMARMCKKKSTSFRGSLSISFRAPSETPPAHEVKKAHFIFLIRASCLFKLNFPAYPCAVSSVRVDVCRTRRYYWACFNGQCIGLLSVSYLSLLLSTQRHFCGVPRLVGTW